MTHLQVALGEVADLIRGITYKPSDVCSPTDPTAVACMRTKNVQESLDESDIVWLPASLIRNSSKYLRPGDILVSSANSWNLVGKGCWVPELKYPASAGGFISILRGNPDAVDLRYLYHWFISPQTQARLRSYSNKTTNISNLDHSRTLATEVPLPPLEEQRRIAGILDKAKILETLAERATKLHEGLIDAFFLSRVGNPAIDDWLTRQAGTMRLSDVAHIRTGKLDANAATQNGQYPFFTCSRTTLSIDSFCFDGEAVLVAGNGDLNVKRHSGKLNAYQRTYIISPKSASPEEADYIYSLLRLYIAKLRSLSIGGVIKYIKLPFLSDLPVGPIDSGVALEISSLHRRLSVGSSLRSTASSRIGSLASSLVAGLMEG